MNLTFRVKKFINTHWDRERNLLLAYSGGPDSKALLYSLFEMGFQNLHLAHVDHGWREESSAECEELKKEAEHLQLPFHSIRLTGVPTKNLEDFGRNQRRQFFQSLVQKFDFQAVLLGHQGDDLAETALKRVLEGAHLTFLGGMAPITQMEGFEIWRPLLSVTKKEILDFLKKRSLKALDDQTNYDPRFLRTRFRQKAIPILIESMGKEIQGNLALLSERAFELKEFLEKRTMSHWQSKIKTDQEILLNFEGLERIEARFLLQKLKLNLTRHPTERLLDSILGIKSKIFYEIKGHHLTAEKNVLRIISM